MRSLDSRCFVLLVCASVAIAGCSGNGPALAPSSYVPGAGLGARPTFVGDRVAPSGASKSTTVTLKPAGGDAAVPKYDDFSGTLPYASNDARKHVTLTLTNAGSKDPMDASKTKTVLYLEARVDGSAKVTFKPATAKASLSSSQLVAGDTYTLYLYSGKKQIAKLDIGQPAKGTLRFPTPLSKVALAPATPLVIAFDQTSQASPTPSPTPTIGPMTVTPTSLTFSSSTPQQFTVEEPGYHGLFVVNSSFDLVAAVKPGSANGPKATFNVTPEGGGTCTMEISDSNNHSALVQVSVSGAVIVVSGRHKNSTR
jgi:hypothetical protein